MAAGVLMPKQGITVESCIISQWYKKKGDRVNVGDMLFNYETDKATFDCESTASGEILEIFYGDGDEVPVLVNVCAIGEPGEDISALRPEGSAPAVAEQKPAAPAESAPAASDAPAAAPAVNMGEIKISPRAKELASKSNIDVRLANPTGPYGRIIERDVREMIANGIGATSAAFDAVKGADAGSFIGTGIGGRVSVDDLSAKSAATAVPAVFVSEGAEYQDIKFTGIRKAIAKSMINSLSTTAQLTNNSSFDATEIMSFRAKLKQNGEKLGMGNITLNDIILYAVSRTLIAHKSLNANVINDTTVREFNDVHLGMAVDTERGLMVPTIRYANRKSLTQIAAEAKELAKQAQSGTISPDLLTGATFTISNLGSLGIESFTPVINPPQTGILGVSTIITRVREVNGEIKTYPAMGLSLTYDHRVVDGAPAARFAKDLAANLENFGLLLAKN